MGVTDFDTKVAVVVRDDLATWQRLNVTAFLMSGIVADAGTTVIGEPYRDADAREYLPLLVQPVLVFIAKATSCERSASAPKAGRCRSPSIPRRCSARATMPTTVPRCARLGPATSTSSGSHFAPRTETPTRFCEG